MLSDDNIHAAQGRVAALLAAGAHIAARVLASHRGDAAMSARAARELAGVTMSVEQLATRVFEATHTTLSRADDVAVAALRSKRGPLTLAEAIEQWSREARETVRCATPSARDLQALAADLARLATHSRAIVRAAVGEQLLDPEPGRGIDHALAESAAGWLEIAELWNGVHTAQPPTPSKIAASHALGQALMAATREGREWAEPSAIAERVDLVAALAAIRRSMDVARDVAEHQIGQPEQLTSSGQLFVAAAKLAPLVERLNARLSRDLAPAGAGDIKDLAGTARRQQVPTDAAATLLNATPRVRRPSPRADTPAARSSGLACR